MATNTQAIVNGLPPLLKWTGGKRWLVPELVKLYEGAGDRMWVEPFFGGGSMGLGIAPRKAMVSDANVRLMNFHRWISEGCPFRESLTPVIDQESNNKDNFHVIRREFNAGDRHWAWVAGAFYYLNATGFKGGYRENMKGEFNIPFAYRKQIVELPSTESLAPYKEIMGEWIIRDDDWMDLSLDLDGDEFLFLDPPYHGTFTGYLQGRFEWDDQMALADFAARHQGPVVACNSATPEILSIYQRRGFDVQIIDAPRGHGKPVKEMFATRNL